jgi:hypothetical protein
MEFSGFHPSQYKEIHWKDYEGQPEVIKKEMDKRHDYRPDLQYAIEGFTYTNTPTSTSTPTTTLINRQIVTPSKGTPVFYTTPDTESVSKNISTIQNLQKNNSLLTQKLLTKYTDLSNNVPTVFDKRAYLLDNNEKYNYWGKDDPNVILRPEESRDIRTALQHDVTEMKLYQNSIYISTAIACSTLLIAAIIISKS